MTSKRVVLSFAALFFSAASGLLVCFILASAEHPWAFDDKVNSKIIGLSSNLTFTQWIDSQGPEISKGVKTYLSSLYSAIIISVASNCILVLFVIFFASSNAPLILCTQAGVCLMMFLVSFTVPSVMENSVHYRLFVAILLLNGAGLLLHAWKTRLFSKSSDEEVKPAEPTNNTLKQE